MKFPKVQTLNIDKNEYVVIKKKEYNKVEKLLTQYMEDLEDSKLIKEAIMTSKKNYTIEEVAKKHNIKLDKI